MIHCEAGHLLCAGGAQCVATSHVCDGDRGELLTWNSGMKKSIMCQMHIIDLLLRRIFNVFECSTKV